MNVIQSEAPPTLSEWLEADPCWERVIMVVVIGAGLGAACASIVGVLIVLPQDAKAALPNGVGVGMVFGIPLGAVLAPAMFPLLRAVPIHRVVWGCCAGTIVGSFFGFGLTLPLRDVRALDGIVSIGLVGGAILGLLVATVYLWAVARQSRRKRSERQGLEDGALLQMTSSRGVALANTARPATS